jgi:hypothetical protein
MSRSPCHFRGKYRKVDHKVLPGVEKPLGMSMNAQINAITVIANKRYYCSTLQTLVACAKLPATFPGESFISELARFPAADMQGSLHGQHIQGHEHIGGCKAASISGTECPKAQARAEGSQPIKPFCR